MKKLTMLVSVGMLLGACGDSNEPQTSQSNLASVGHPPNLQLPFPCNEKWRFDSWAHAPALDMVKEPNQGGTEGATLVTPAPGKIKTSFYHKNAGNVIQIDHGNGWFTTYLHLQSRSLEVGATVKTGTVIGKVGKTGPTANNNSHLHFELAFDANKDGQATWGGPGTERVSPVFNGKKYGIKNKETSQNVVSNNSCGTDPGPDPEPTKYLVDTFADASGHSSPGGTKTGVLKKGTNYVYCKVKGPEVKEGHQLNTWWLKTDLDQGNPWQNQWVSAYYLKRWGNNIAKDNDGREIPNC